MKHLLVNLILFSTYGYATEFVPLTISKELSKLGNLDLVQKFENDSLCFESAESSFGLGIVRNCISEFSIGKNTFWLMKQDIKIKAKTVQNLIGTYVDLETKTAYYLELKRDLFEKAGAFEAIGYKVPCAMCHPSGPRVIRPTQENFNAFNRTEILKLNRLNRKIENYKILKTYIPEKSFAKKLFPDPSHANEILKLPQCYECHNSKYGVRAELTLDQLPSIRYLAFSSKDHMGAAQMPPKQEDPLSIDALECLQDWFNKKMNESCLKEADNNINSKNNIEVKVKTSFHEFLVTNLPIEIKNGGILIDLTDLKTGIKLRDNHIKTLFDVKKFPKIVGTFSLNERALKSPMTHAVNLKIKEEERPVQVLISCDEFNKSCVVSGAVDLSQWGFVMPSFLGIKVAPVIEVSGTINLKKNDLYRKFR